MWGPELVTPAHVCARQAKRSFLSSRGLPPGHLAFASAQACGSALARARQCTRPISHIPAFQGDAEASLPVRRVRSSFKDLASGKSKTERSLGVPAPVQHMQEDRFDAQDADWEAFGMPNYSKMLGKASRKQSASLVWRSTAAPTTQDLLMGQHHVQNHGGGPDLSSQAASSG